MSEAGESAQNPGREDVVIEQETSCHKGFIEVARLSLKYRRYDGRWSALIHREVMRRAPGVGVLLYDPVTDRVLLVEQFRVGCLDNPAGPWVLELVAGIVDDVSESPEAVAIREAKEEANQHIEHLLPVCEYYNSPGGSNEKLHIFCACVDLSDASGASGVFGLDEEHEDIRALVLDRSEAMSLLAQGRLNNAMSIIALQWLALHLDEVQQQFRPGAHTRGS